MILYYKVHFSVLDSTDDFIISAVALPSIVDGSVTTDKRFYYGGLGEKAKITSTVINSSASIPLDGLDVIVTVMRPV